MLDRIFERIIKLRWFLFVGLIVACAALTPFVQRAVVPDNALTVWFLETDPQLEAYRDFQKSFGNDEVVFLLVESPSGVFEAPFLGKLEGLVTRLEKIEGVARVTSLLSLDDMVDGAEGLELRPLVPRPIPTAVAELATVQARATASSLVRDRIVSADSKRTMVWVQMATMEEFDSHRDAIVSQIRSTADSVLGPLPHPMGGIGVIYSGLNALTSRDFGMFLGIGYLLMFAGVYWVFRSVKIVLACLGVVAVGNYAALGIYGAMGDRMNMVTAIIPLLIIILGLTDAIHYPAGFLTERRDGPKERSVRETLKAALRSVAGPCLFTTLTTVGGFLALATSPMKAIRDLGIYSAIGLLLAFVALNIIMPLALHSLSPRRAEPRHRWLEGLLRLAVSTVSTRPIAVAVVLGVAVVGGAIGALLVVNDTYTLGYLPDDYVVVQDHNRIVRDWGHYNVVDFLVTPKDGAKLDQAEAVNALERFVAEAEKDPEIRSGFGMGAVYRRMGENLGLDKKAGEPWTQPEIAQLNVMLDGMGLVWKSDSAEFGRNPLSPFTTEDRQLGHVFFTARMMSAMDLDRLLHRLEAASRAAGTAIDIVPAGYPPLYVKIIRYVTESQVSSFFSACGIIFVLMILWLRSLRLALISLLPNLFPVLLMLGAMGWLGIRLDIATAGVAAIVLGMSIDDTVHFLHHWQHAERRGLTWSQACDYVFRHAGVPAVISSVLLVIGFPVLMLAEVKTVVYFGLLTTFSAIVAVLGDLFMLPLLLRIWPAAEAKPGESTAP